MFGDLVYEFRADGTFSWSIDGHTETGEYRVVEVGPDYVEIGGLDVSGDTHERIWLEGEDAWWLWAGSESRPFREYFRRIR